MVVEGDECGTILGMFNPVGRVGGRAA